jgi:hypothetical protein
MSRFERGKQTALVVVPQATPEEEVHQAVQDRRQRYAMPLQALDNVKIAGLVATSRLLDILTNDSEKDGFDTLKPLEQAKFIELAMTQAFGRVDSATNERKNIPDPDNAKTVTLRDNLKRLGNLIELPEMRKRTE